MQSEEDEALALLKAGRYYEQAREWYNTLYIAPISERAQFLMLGLLAGLVGVVGFVALIMLLPLAEKPGLVISNPRIDLAQPSLVRLRFDGEGTVNDALRRFLVLHYVIARESYVPENWERNSLFVTAHSDEAELARYAAIAGPQNPRNPVAMLGETGKRLVSIDDYTLNQTGDVQKATVKFSTDIVSVTSLGKSQWTAVIEFYYSDAATTTVKDPETGKDEITLQEPTFQVIRYALTQNS